MWEKITYLLMRGVKTSEATMKISVELPQKSEIDLPQDPAIPLSGTYTKGSLSYCRDTCLLTFIIALFRRVWKENESRPTNG